jgi:hypothetical protein
LKLKICVNPLHLWTDAICRAQNDASLGEVVKMNEHLSKFYKKDKGFEQFAKRFNKVSSDEDTSKKYKNWLMEMRLEALDRARILAEGRAERYM